MSSSPTTPAAGPVPSDAPWQDLFDGRSLAGWRSVPRVYGSLWPQGPSVYEVAEHLSPDDAETAARHPASWRVEDGVLIGEQQPHGSGFGGYLLSEATFGDVELELEVRPDWPADTGVMLRRRPDSWEGFQVLVDHRRSGSIGGFFGNGLASFHAVPYALDVEVDPVTGAPVRLVEEDPATSLEPFTQAKRDLLDRAGDPAEFLAAWEFGGWNHLRVLCVGGALPRLTTWVNGVLVAELDTSRVLAEHYDPAQVAALLGERGHLALEVHDNDARFGDDRWGPGAACRWRNLRIRELGR